MGKIMALALRPSVGVALQLVLLSSLFSIGAPSSATSVMETTDVFSMIRGLRDFLLVQDCTALGARPAGDCVNVNTSRTVSSPYEVVASLSSTSSPLFAEEDIDPAAMLQGWIDGTRPVASAVLADGGIQEAFARRRRIVDDLALKVESTNVAFEHKPFGPQFFNETDAGNIQLNWAATPQTDGPFVGRAVNREHCAFHLPQTEPEDRLRTDRDLLYLERMCATLKENLVANEALGLSFQTITSLNGVTMDYPGSLRGLADDARFEPWFKDATQPPKDVVVIVDQSGSMGARTDCSPMRVAEAMVQALIRSWVTPVDRVQLVLLPREPTFAPCFGPRLVRGTSANVERLLRWFRDESQSRGGLGSMSNGVLEALTILRGAQHGHTSTGAARFLVVVSDGLDAEDIVQEGVRRWEASSGDDPEAKDLLAKLHLVSVSLTRGGTAEVMNRAACGQQGLSFAATVQTDDTKASDCAGQPAVVTTTDPRVPPASIDVAMLLNASDLPRLSALPRAAAPPVAWGMPRVVRSGGGPDGKTRIASTLSRAVFDRKGGFDAVPRLLGAVGVEFYMEDVFRAIRDLELPLTAQVFLMQHAGEGGGLCLTHSATPPDYPDYKEAQEAAGNPAVRVSSLEGNTVTSGVPSLLDRITSSTEGSSPMERRLVLDVLYSPLRAAERRQLVRIKEGNVTYFWKRIPDTDYTLVAVLPDRVSREGGTTARAPRLRRPARCASSNNAAGCFTPAYDEWAAIYHRFDLLPAGDVPLRTTAPWGGVETCGSEWCTLDASTWSAHGIAFRSRAAFEEEEETQALLQGFAAWQDGAAGAAPSLVMGRGLKQQALAELEASAALEPFWKDFLGVGAIVDGVPGADGSGMPATLDATKARRRGDVLSLRLLTPSGVLREYPGKRGTYNRTYNARREQWYTSAIAQPGLSAISSPELVTGPPREDGSGGTFWAATISRALPHGSPPGADPDLFGVVAVTYRYAELARMLRGAVSLRSSTKVGCDDLSNPDEAGLSCFLLDSAGVVLMDRRLLALDKQAPESLTFRPELYPLYEVDPFIFESLIQTHIFSPVTARYANLRHRAYQVNHSTLVEWTADQRLAAAATGEPGPEFEGMEMTVEVKRPSGFATHRMWFYKVPGSGLYLLVVTNHQSLTAPTFCGPLSRHCPSVSPEAQSVQDIDACSDAAEAEAHVTPGRTAYTPPTPEQMVKLRNWTPSAEWPGQFRLTCPASLLPVALGTGITTLMLMVAGAVTSGFALRIWRKRSRAEKLEDASAGRGEVPVDAAKPSKWGDAPIEANLADYKKLAGEQWQLAEDLFKRDEGEQHALRQELGQQHEDGGVVLDQLDYLQSRMEKQERMTPSFQRLRREVAALADRGSTMSSHVEGLKTQGHFPGLDPTMQEDTTQLRETMGETLPAGMREALFHRINFPHIVAGLPEEFSSVATPRAPVILQEDEH